MLGERFSELVPQSIDECMAEWNRVASEGFDVFEYLRHPQNDKELDKWNWVRGLAARGRRQETPREFYIAWSLPKDSPLP